MISYSEACGDPNLFGPWFSGDSWSTWRVLDRALFGEPLDDAQMAIFRELTGREEVPVGPVSEAWMICGRRSGKDVKAASLVAYLATIGAEVMGFANYLTPGERGVVQLLAVDRDQARVCLGYLQAMFEQPILASMVARAATDGLDLKNRLSIEITTNDQRRVRGRTVVAAVFDETAFWHGDNSARPDTETYAAVKPSMATVPGAMLIGISSPRAKRGLLYDRWKRHWGKPGRVLVVKAPTWVMNPTLPRDGDFITEAFEEDAANASAEFGAEWRVDVEQFVDLETVQGCVTPDVRERPWKPSTTYRAFVDPSGGSKDAMTLAIGHLEAERAVLDVMREIRPPFSPASVVDEFALLLRSYGVSRVTGDRYGAQWVAEAFMDRMITYEHSDLNRSEIYLNFLPLLNSGRADLLDSDRLVSQIAGLERRSVRGGRDTVDHPPNGHDDLCNAVAGVLVNVAARKTSFTLANI